YRTSSGTTSATDRERELLQFNSKLDLGAGWKLGTLVQLPFVEKTTTTFNSLNSQSNGGFSDAVFQAALIHTIDTHWAYGFGARLVAPTAEESLGSGRWQIMPGLGVRYSFLEIGPDTYFVPVMRYAISFAGDPTRRNISELQIAPTLNIGLPDRWFVTLYPSNDIRINYGTPVSGQTGRLFLPLDMAIGRKFTNNLIISLEGSVPIIKDYPVYDFKTELKVTWQF
ncbi:MAG: transporter, partial [Rhizomicrobium sp.]